MTSTATRERPILFSAPMVRAILDGRKTQTRRIVKPQPAFDRAALTDAGWARDERGRWCFPNVCPEVRIDCPYGVAGDTLIFLATWASEKRFDKVKPSRLPDDARIWSLFDGADKPDWCGRSRAGRFMPKRLRAALPRGGVLSVRVERVQEISESDARAEGVEPLESDAHESREEFDRAQCEQCGGLRLYTSFSGDGGANFDTDCGKCDTHAKRFRNLWNSINAKRSPWSSNDWVWVVEFRRVKP